MRKIFRDNGGYSLVELLLTIFIFGIVMVGIAAIMRTTTISYGDGLAAVDLQTEAQIVANQIEELFIDSTDKVSYSHANGYWWANNGSGKSYLKYDSAEKKLYYQESTGDPSDANWSLMADYVSAITIDNTSADDNMIRVQLAMDNDGYLYTTVKEVYYRNNVEDKSSHQIGGGGGAGGGSGEDEEYDYVITVDRYDIIDLELECGIAPTSITVPDDSKFAGKYSFYNVNYASGKVYSVDSMSSAPSAQTAVSQYISTNATYNTSTGTAVKESDKCYLSGKDADDNPVTVCFVSDSVSYDMNTTKDSTDGLLMFSGQPGDMGRIMNWVNIKGFNVANYVNYFGGSVTAVLCAYYDNGNRQWDSGEETKTEMPGMNQSSNAKKTYNIAKVSGANSLNLENFPSNALNNGTGGVSQLNVIVGVDAQTGDLFLAQANSAVTDTAFNSGKVRIAMITNIPGVTDDAIDFNVFLEGGDGSTGLGAYTGGNKYEKSLGAF